MKEQSKTMQKWKEMNTRVMREYTEKFNKIPSPSECEEWARGRFVAYLSDWTPPELLEVLVTQNTQMVMAAYHAARIATVVELIRRAHDEGSKGSDDIVND